MIGSTADADKNKLDTGTLGFGDIKNKAEYKVESHSVGLSTGGMSPMTQVVSNAAGSLLTNVNSSGSASNTTHSAVSEGEIVIRDKDNQKQNINELSRDAESSHSKLDAIFDKEREQKRIEKTQLLGEISQQIKDITVTNARINAAEKVDKDQPGLSKDDRNKAIEAQINKDGWGIGGDKRRMVDSGTALIEGLVSGDVNRAVANASAPYIANIIAQNIGQENKAGRIAAHGIANVALALAKGENAAAQSLGAMTGEAAGMLSEQLYSKQPHELSESERAEVSAYATLAAGIAGGLAGGDLSTAANAAQAGKTTVENNHLSPEKNQSRSEEFAKCNGDESCRSDVKDKYRKEYDSYQDKINSCSSAQQCTDIAKEIKEWQREYGARMNDLQTKARETGLTAEEALEWGAIKANINSLDGSRVNALSRANMLGGSADTSKELDLLIAGAGIGAGAGSHGGKGNKGNKDNGPNNISTPSGSSPDNKIGDIKQVSPEWKNSITQSRVNVRNGDGSTGSGLEYAWKKHGGEWGANKSHFTITKDELKVVLQSDTVVKAPVQYSPSTGNYIRTVDMGKNIGVDAMNNSTPTSTMTVITDKNGNLINTLPR